MSKFKLRDGEGGEMLGGVSPLCTTVNKFSGKIIHENKLSFLFEILAFTKYLMVKEVVTIYYIK